MHARCRSDSLTGQPISQKSPACEKSAVLFVIAALHTQIGASQDRAVRNGLNLAADHFCRAAGLFEYIFRSFKSGPNMDMCATTLDSFKLLTIAEAQECLCAKMLLHCTRPGDVTSVLTADILISFFDQFGMPSSITQPRPYHLASDHNDLSAVSLFVVVAQQASRVAKAYASVQQSMSSTKTVEANFPPSWLSLVKVKMQYFKSLSHYYFGRAVKLCIPNAEDEAAIMVADDVRNRIRHDPRMCSVAVVCEDRHGNARRLFCIFLTQMLTIACYKARWKAKSVEVFPT